MKTLVAVICCWMQLVFSMPYFDGFGEPDTSGWIPYFPQFAYGAKLKEDLVTPTIPVVSVKRLLPPTYWTVSSLDHRPAAAKVSTSTITAPVMAVASGSGSVDDLSGHLSLPPA